MATTLHVFYSKILASPVIASSSLTVSLGPLSSQFCWTALALSPSPSSAPAELCPLRLPSGRRRNRPWIPRPQRSLSRSWMRNCCSPNLTPHLKDEEQFTGTNCNCSANFNYLFIYLLFIYHVTQIWLPSLDVLIGVGNIKPDKFHFVILEHLYSVYTNFHVS